MTAPMTRAMGFMTGTSMDGLDAAILETDGGTRIVPGPALSAPFEPGLRRRLKAAAEAARAWDFDGAEPAAFAEAEAALTEAHATLAARLLEQAGLGAADIDVIGMHGQTVLHRRPERGRPGRTRQLGDGPALAAFTGIAVVSDFRSADMKAGGQGAPFAPLYHAALAERDGLARPLAVLNLGGVGNLTLIDADGGVVAFDTGPANGPLDDWIESHGGGLYDSNGEIAARGSAAEPAVEALLAHSYFDAPPPKSLDRAEFTADAADGMSLEDGARLLTEFAAAAAARGLAWAKTPPRRLILVGGGRRNPVLAEAVARRSGVETVAAEAAGWRGDELEAELFAWMAVRSLRGLPLSSPSTTGCARAVSGGVLSPAPQASPSSAAAT